MAANKLYCTVCKQQRPKRGFLFRVDRTIAICGHCRDRHAAAILQFDTEQVNRTNAATAAFVNSLVGTS